MYPWNRATSTRESSSTIFVGYLKYISQNFINIIVGKNNENYTYPEMSDILIFELFERIHVS